MNKKLSFEEYIEKCNFSIFFACGSEIKINFFNELDL